MSAALNLKTTVVCTSAQREYFDFLPPFGMYLDPGQEFTADGDVFDWLRMRSGGSYRAKAMEALQYALDNDLIEIKNTPSQVLFDPTADKSQVLSADDGDLQISDIDGANTIAFSGSPLPVTTTGA